MDKLLDDPLFLGNGLIEMKRKSYARMEIEPGYKVLDVGCGPGADTLPLARLVGESGEVMGIDYDPHVIAEANQRALDAGISHVVKHEQGNAMSLPYQDAMFDACRSEKLFQQLLFPERVLFEMRRVTKRARPVVVLDTDWSTLSLHTSEAETERKLFNFMLEAKILNGCVGRQLLQLFKEQGLTNISFEVLPLCITSYELARELVALDEVEKDAVESGVITQDELQRWHARFEQLERDGSFFGSVNLILMAGRVA